MGRDDDPQGQAERLDVVEVGGSHGRGWPARPWRWWLVLVLAVGVTAAVVARAEHGRIPFASPTTPDPATSAPSSPSGGSTGDGMIASAPLVTDVGHPLLGVASGWELLGRTPTGVVRIELARGRITRTAVPALASTGPVSFVVGRDWAMVRPLDFVPGYVVPDGRPARALTGALSLGGPALPGPEQASVWVPTGPGHHPAMVLVRADGRSTGVSVAIPPGMTGNVEPDGKGYLLLSDLSGVYDARPNGLHRVTTGVLLAVGPSRWLTLECDDQHRCATVVTDRGTSAEHVLDSPVDQASGSPGVISPDGATAAVHQADSAGVTTVHLLDLASGADRRLDVPIDRSFNDAPMAWSPDSRWLFIAGESGRLFPVDAATAQVRDLGAPLPAINQLAIRNTPVAPSR
jgi:hypothetical protein